MSLPNKEEIELKEKFMKEIYNEAIARKIGSAAFLEMYLDQISMWWLDKLSHSRKALLDELIERSVTHIGVDDAPVIRKFIESYRDNFLDTNNKQV